MSALLALLLGFVLPAVAGTVLLADPVPDQPPPDPARGPSWDIVLARGLACGLVAWLFGSGLLARTVGLDATSAWVWDAVVAAASVVVLLLPRSRARLRTTVGPAVRRFASVGGLTALVYAPLAIVILRTSWSPLGSTPWYYYGLARQVADAGSIPSTSVEFATSTPFLNDYHLFTTGTAMLLVQHPHGPMAVITMVTFIGVLLLALGTAATASALGARPLTALLVVPPVVGTGLGAIRLAAYRPEGFGLGLTMLIVALSIDWFRRRDPRSLGAAVVLVALLSQVHGIAALTAGVLVTAAALTLVIQGPRREQLKRAGIAVALFLGSVLATGLVFHEASGTAHAGGLIDTGGIADPTWEFYMAARGDPPSIPQSNGAMIWQSLRGLYGGSYWWVLPVLVLAVIGVRRGRRDPDVRLLVGYTLWALLGLALVAGVFMFGWQGYVPRRTGGSRMVLEASLLVPPFLAIGLGSLAEAPWRWRRRTLMRQQHRLPFLIALLSVTSVVSMVGAATYDVHTAPSQADVATWRSLPVKPGDVVLTNGYTEGYVPDVTPGIGLLDGRAPYTFGGLLHRANGLLRGGRAFYADPAAHWGFLAQHGVKWVVVGKPGTFAISTGNTWSVPAELDALSQCSGLQQVASRPDLVVYRVVDSGPQGCSNG